MKTWMVFAYLEKDHDAYDLFVVRAENEKAAIEAVTDAAMMAVDYEAKALDDDQAAPHGEWAGGVAHRIGSGGETRFL